jgi:hypothetical protein
VVGWIRVCWRHNMQLDKLCFRTVNKCYFVHWIINVLCCNSYSVSNLVFITRLVPRWIDQIVLTAESTLVLLWPFCKGKNHVAIILKLSEIIFQVEIWCNEGRKRILPGKGGHCLKLQGNGMVQSNTCFQRVFATAELMRPLQQRSGKDHFRRITDTAG